MNILTEGKRQSLLSRKAISSIASVSFLVIALVIGVLPSVASAASLTDRSAEITSASASATGVQYTIGFTTSATAGAVTLEFCGDSPIIGDACAAPAGFSVASAGTTGSGNTVHALTTPENNGITWIGASSLTAGANSIVLTNVTNPSASGVMYIRIVTYDTATNAEGYKSTAIGANAIDSGAAAVSINDTVGVSADVLETLNFCVSGNTIAKDCVTDGSSTALNLGETNSGVTALSQSAVSTGNIYVQLSTNALSGAVVRLKSSAVGCGGLVRSGDPAACDIAPALATGITAGQAKFGVETTTAVASALATDATGVLQPAGGSAYSNSAYSLNYVSGDATGVTSTYGDPFLDTNSHPVNNMNMHLIFGASISNVTPAGHYSVDISLVATGKY